MLKDFYQKCKLYGWKKFIAYAVREVRRKLYTQPVKGSYSQNGEDLIIDKILGFKRDGFYIDIGAGDPKRFNNTKRFYLRGWRGVNIEPNVSIFKRIERDRKRDINLNVGIGNDEGKMSFFVFFPDTLSTFSGEVAKGYINQGYKMIREVKIEVRKLAKIFEEYARGVVDFLSIDTEGYNLDVLKSNDWGKYRPRLICVETGAHGRGNSKNLSIENYLKSVDYIKPISKISAA